MRKSLAHVSALLVFVLLVPSLLHAWSGKVVGVADGDTITVLRKKKQVRIRLHGVDTPEKKQAFGQQAKSFTAQLTTGKVVDVKQTDTDKYGRAVAVITVDGVNVNRALVEAGYAWVYRKYCEQRYCRDWIQLEYHAKTERLGLWADPNPISPSQWRRAQRENPKAAAIAGAFHGNTRSHVFHARGCQHFNCKNCMIGFETQQEATKAGYRPHRDCVK